MIPVSERHVSHDIKQIDLGEYAGYVCKDSFAKLENNLNCNIKWDIIKNFSL